MSENATDAKPPGPPQSNWGRIIVRGILVAIVVIVVPRLLHRSFGPPPADVGFVIAEGDRAAGRLDQAIAEYSTFIASNPNDPRGYAGRGEAYRLKHDNPHALADFAAAIERDPRNYEAYLDRCRANRDSGAIEGAIADCRQAATVRSDKAEPLLLLGHMLLARGEIADAKAQLEAAVVLQKETFSGEDARIVRGLIALFHQNRPDAAAEDFAAAHKRALATASDKWEMLDRDEEAALAAVSYLAIWRHIARVRAGQDDAAEVAASLAQSVDPVARDWWLKHPISENPKEAQVLRISLNPWPARFIGLYAGRLTPDDVRAAAAETKGDAAARARRACDADLYLGIYLVEKGTRDEAIKLLRAAATSSCAAAPLQAGFAKAELARIGS